MNNLYNITNKNGFYNKLTAISALLVPLLYLLSVTLIPVVKNNIINTKNNTYASAAKPYNGLTNKVLATKINNAASNTINTATYINNGQMLARQIDNNNLQNYVSDVKGSVLKLNSADKSQNQTYSYAAYGKPIANITKANFALNVSNPFQYNGERYDNNTNLQYLRARFYNPENKRFINQDAYNLLNRFGYVNSNPVMGADPTGHVFKSAISLIFSAKKFFSRHFGVRISGETIKSAYNRGEKDFSRMNLSGAKLSWANLSGANLSLANLSGAKLFWADLTGVIVDYNTIIDTQMPFQSQQKHDLWNKIEDAKREMEKNMVALAVLRDTLSIPFTLFGPRSTINGFIIR